jgi:hypothetical protein
MDADALMADIRESHLKAYLRGETLLTPIELQAVVRESIRARRELLRRCMPHITMSMSTTSGRDFQNGCRELLAEIEHIT